MQQQTFFTSMKIEVWRLLTYLTNQGLFCHFKCNVSVSLNRSCRSHFVCRPTSREPLLSFINRVSLQSRLGTSPRRYRTSSFLFAFFYLTNGFFVISFFLQQLASLSLVELCKAASGEDGCTTVSPAEISVLLHSLESPAASLRFATLQGLLVLTDILSAGDHGTAQTAQLVRRLWVAKFDVDDENAKLGEK